MVYRFVELGDSERRRIEELLLSIDLLFENGLCLTFVLAAEDESLFESRVTVNGIITYR